MNDEMANLRRERALSHATSKDEIRDQAVVLLGGSNPAVPKISRDSSAISLPQVLKVNHGNRGSGKS